MTFGSAGKVDEILVKEGDKVRTGDVLARLDTSSLELARTQSQFTLTQAEAALAQARLTYDTVEYNLKNTRDTEDSLRLALLNAEIGLNIAEEDLKNTIKTYDWDAYLGVESELNKAQTFYEYALNGLNTASGDTMNWELALERAEERLEIAQANYNNYLAGYTTTSLITLKRKQIAAAEMSVAQAQKAIDDLAEYIALQELHVASAAQAIEQAQQAVELAELSVNESQRQLDETAITAPFDGVVAVVMVKEGDIIPSPSMFPQTVVHLINPDYLELVIEVDEIDIPLIEMNQKAVVEVDALPDDEFTGIITAVYPVPKEVGGVVLYNVRIGLDVPANSGIKIGMSASADIVADKHSDVLMVPSRAVIENDQGQTIVKVMSDEEIEERVVVVGLDDGLRTEIVSGLQEGETIVYEIKVKSTSMGMFSVEG